MGRVLLGVAVPIGQAPRAGRCLRLRRGPSGTDLPRCSLQVQAEVKRKWRSWKVNRYFAVDFKQRQPSLASSGVNGGTQLSILSKSSSQIRVSGLPADNLAT